MRTITQLLNTLRSRPLASHELTAAEWEAMEALAEEGRVIETWRPGRSWVLAPTAPPPALERLTSSAALAPPPNPTTAPNVGLTAEQRAEALRLRAKGESLRLIGLRLGCGEGVIRRILTLVASEGIERALIPTRRRYGPRRTSPPAEPPPAALRLSLNQIAKIRRLDAQGLSPAAIAKRAGTSAAAVLWIRAQPSEEL